MTITLNGTTGITTPADTVTGNASVGGDLTVTGNVSGTWNGTAVSVAKGGTGATTLTANNVLLGNGTSAVQVVAPGTSGNVLTSNGTTWASSAPAATGITSGTAVASTSGTSIDFTGIPSTVKRITVMFNGVSTTGTSPIQIQLGTSSGISATGYDSYGVAVTASAGVGGTSSSTGFVIGNGVSSTSNQCGIITLVLFGSNQWCSSGILSATNNARDIFGAGANALSGILDRVRITTVNGTDTFDAGSINILYE